MLEVVFFVILVLIVIISLFGYTSYRERKLIKESERIISQNQEKIKIAERKFMQRKIKKSVFDMILEDLEEQILLAQMTLFRLKKSPSVSIEDKAQELFLRLEKPTNHRKKTIESLLKDTEVLRTEMSMLEGKLMKREIRESVFERLIKDKEKEMIEKERKLIDLLK